MVFQVKTTLREEVACVETRRANGNLEIRAPSMKRTRKGRPRSPYPTGSPHRNSKVYGKGGDDGGAKGTPKLTGKCSSGTANTPPCMSFNNGAKFKTPARCNFGDKCVRNSSFRPFSKENQKTRFAKCADAGNLRERHAEEILTIGRTELRLPKDLAI